MSELSIYLIHQAAACSGLANGITGPVTQKVLRKLAEELQAAAIGAHGKNCGYLAPSLMVKVGPALPAHFGASDKPTCAKCNNRLHLTRREPHPIRGHAFERQTFTCRLCKHSIERDADLMGEVFGGTLSETTGGAWPANTVSSNEESARLDRALEDMVKNHSTSDFIECLNSTLDDIVRNE